MYRYNPTLLKIEVLLGVTKKKNMHTILVSCLNLHFVWTQIKIYHSYILKFPISYLFIAIAYKYWQGGKANEGEAATQTACRELWEECGGQFEQRLIDLISDRLNSSAVKQGNDKECRLLLLPSSLYALYFLSVTAVAGLEEASSCVVNKFESFMLSDAGSRSSGEMREMSILEWVQIDAIMAASLKKERVSSPPSLSLSYFAKSIFRHRVTREYFADLAWRFSELHNFVFKFPEGRGGERLSRSQPVLIHLYFRRLSMISFHSSSSWSGNKCGDEKKSEIGYKSVYMDSLTMHEFSSLVADKDWILSIQYTAHSTVYCSIV